MKATILVAVLVLSLSKADFLTEFETCKRADPNLPECLRKAIQDALPKLTDGYSSLKFPTIQPLEIPSMTIGEGKGTVHVVQKFKNVKIYGIPSAKINKVGAEVTDPSIALTVNAFLDDLKLEGDYDFNGRVLVLPIVGNGKCSIQLEKLSVELTLNGAVFQKKGVDYVGLKEVTLKLDPKKVIFNFENLFNGDKRLGAEMNRVLNENWKDVFQDVQSGYEESLAIVIQSVANTIFKKIPYNKLLAL